MGEASIRDLVHDCACGARLSALLAADEVDAAIDAGLMAFVPCASCDPAASHAILQQQRRLSTNWAARDRYLARQARLARRTEERDAKRNAVTPTQSKSALPSAAAAILARAKAKAAAGRAGR